MMNKDNLIIVLCILLVILLLRMCSDNKLEHMSYNNEACDTLSSMYNNQKVTTTNLHATGNINFLPKGSIILWHGKKADVPDGWKVCDGHNDTPNMINRYAIGTGFDNTGTRHDRRFRMQVNTNTT